VSEPITDEALMTRYVRENDRAAFKALYKRYVSRLHSFFMRSVGDPDIARDLVQQTFMHFHRARNDFRLDAPVRPWLYTIAINVRREIHRKRRRKPETQFDPETHPIPTTTPDVTTASERLVRRSLDALPEAQRTVLLLHWYEGYSYKEIAEMLGSTPGAVKVRASRAYAKLRVLLQGGEQ